MLAKHKKLLLVGLSELYPNPRSELDFVNEYQLLVAVLLSAQCTDKKVNEVTPTLFKRYASFRALSRAELAELEEIIRPINYFKTKSKNLLSTAKTITEKLHGKLPTTHAELTALPGVGNKTANVVLGELGLEFSLPVDTHVFRLAHRLGLSTGKTPKAVEEDLKKQFPPEEWRGLHHRLIFHGRRVCKAINPQCDSCLLLKICPTGKARVPR
jgi:endonuclease-3